MQASRLLRPSCYLLAALTYPSTQTYHRHHRVALDTSPFSTWPQDASLIRDGRRSLRSLESSASKQDSTASKKGDADTIDKTNPPESYTPNFEDDDDFSWKSFSTNFNTLVNGTKKAIERVEWSGIGDKITDYFLPAWARSLPDFLTKLQDELSMKPGTLSDEIWQEAHDPNINPEILWDARVRVSSELCMEEREFRRNRKEHVVKALARYLDIKDTDVDPDDVPTIALCSSGGGLRAMIAGSSSYLCAQEAGLYDCTTYTAGVSGSCWLQSLYFSSLGQQNYTHLIQHLKNRCGTHIAFPPTALKLVTSTPTSKFLLSGWVEKLKGDPSGSFGLVDVYSLLLAARFMVPKGDLDVHSSDLKLSNQRWHLEGPSAGKHPMPIYTAVRHEIPLAEVAAETEKSGETAKEHIKEKAKQEAWFSWVEMSPFEVFCEDFGAGIPTWSLGRPFKQGRNMLLDTGVALPEIRQSLLLGIWGSAFCATLSHYRHELQLAGLAGLAGFGQLDELLEDKNDDLVRIHPIEPATIPNFVYGMEDQLPQSCPQSVFQTDHLQLMDAGMSNNLPIYPLLRPGRDIDVVVVFDSSADIQTENWLSVVDDYASARGIHSWPVGTGFPKSSNKLEVTAQMLEAKVEAATPQEAAGKVAEAREKGRREGESESADQKTIRDKIAQSALDHCNVWIGTTDPKKSGEESAPSQRLSLEDETEDATTSSLMNPNAGLAVVYFPLLPNEKVAGIDPDKTDFLSTWNFIYTPEQIDQVVALARANFEEGSNQTKRTVRAVYERKKMIRLERESRDRIKFWRRKLREAGDHFSS